MLIGGVLSAITFGVLACLVKVQVLKDDHAARGPAVSMTGEMEFSFHNPLYADAFAKANKCSLFPWVVSKYSRGPSLLRGKAAAQVIGAAVVLATIGHSIVFGIMNAQWGRPGASSLRGSNYGLYDLYKYSSPSNGSSGDSRTPSYYTPTPSYGSRSLRSQIDSAKAETEDMKSELKTLHAQLASLSLRMDGYQHSVANQASRAAAGQGFNLEASMKALSNYNDLVAQYKGLLADVRKKEAAYRAQIDSVNEMVNRYNSGAR
jgi:hypothetical protein